MPSEKPICNPLTTSICLTELNDTQLESEREYMSHVAYASDIGILMYSMVYTRPILAQVVSMMSKYMSKPRKEH